MRSRAGLRGDFGVAEAALAVEGDPAGGVDFVMVLVLDALDRRDVYYPYTREDHTFCGEPDLDFIRPGE